MRRTVEISIESLSMIRYDIQTCHETVKYKSIHSLPANIWNLFLKNIICSFLVYW